MVLKNVYHILEEVRQNIPKKSSHEVRLALCLYSEAPEMIELRVSWYHRQGPGGANLKTIMTCLRRFSLDEIDCMPENMDIIRMISERITDDYLQRFSLFPSSKPRRRRRN